jgi:hypothetical protein
MSAGHRVVPSVEEAVQAYRRQHLHDLAVAPVSAQPGEMLGRDTVGHRAGGECKRCMVRSEFGTKPRIYSKVAKASASAGWLALGRGSMCASEGAPQL